MRDLPKYALPRAFANRRGALVTELLLTFHASIFYKQMAKRQQLMDDKKPAMNRIESFLLGLVLGVATLYGAMHYTVVRAKDGFHFIPKFTARLDTPYVDIRSLNLEQWQRRQLLALSILKAKKGYLLEDQRLSAFKLSTQELLEQYAADGRTRTSRL